MHNVLVSSGSLPSVALCFSNASKIDQMETICKMFENTIIQQFTDVNQVETRR